MPFARDYHRLDVWHRSHALTLGVYRLTAGFPPDERFGLTSQLRRSCGAIATNLVEGSERTGSRAFAAFVDIAAASAAETDYLLVLSRDLGFAAPEAISPLCDDLTQIRRMLNALRSRLRSSSQMPAPGIDATSL